MKRSTLLLVVAAGLLAVVTFLVTRQRDPGPPAGLTVAGYATAEQLAQDKARKLLDGPLEVEHPIDEIVLERASGTVHLVREGSGKEATWKLTAPIDAVAVKYLVEKITGAFRTTTESVFATAVKEADLALYDLEPERRVGLTLKSKGAVYAGVDLWIGRTEAADDAVPGQGRGGESEADTWVMVKSDHGKVYRLGGKDLRTPASEPLENLRDKLALAVKADALREITVTGPDGRRVVLTGTKQEAPPAAPPAEGEEPKPAPEATVTWAMSEPAGVKADAAVSALARGLAGLRAKTFVPAAEAPKTALTGPVWKLTAKAEDGATIELVVQDGGKDDVWARVSGRDELMTLNGYTADVLRKTVEDLQDKTVLELVPEQITALTVTSPDGPLHLDRGESGAWAFTAPALPYAADVAGVLPGVAKLTCLRWARPDEVAAARTALGDGAEVLRGAVTTATGSHALVFSAKLTGDVLEGKRWGVVGDPATAPPFLVQDYAATRFQVTVDKLRQKRLFGERVQADLRALTVASPGADPLVLESAPSGGEPTLAVVPEGKTLDDGALRTLLGTAATLTAKGFVNGRTGKELGLEEPGVTRVTVRFADGASYVVTVSGQTDGTDPYATVDTGPLAGSFFTLNTYQLKNLQKRADELVK